MAASVAGMMFSSVAATRRSSASAAATSPRDDRHSAGPDCASCSTAGSTATIRRPPSAVTAPSPRSG